MTVRLLRFALALPLAFSLGACGGEEKADPRAERDGAVANALDDPIMADPDLASQNRGDAALSGGGPATADIPPDKRTPEEAEKARLAARSFFGGRSIDPAPLPDDTLPESKLAKAATLQAIAEAVKLGGAQCPAKLSYSFGWAARLPAELPVYPRGHARVAAGSDDPGCKLRVVRFVTPVTPTDVVDFYQAAAAKVGLAPQRRKEGGDEVVSGGKGAARFAVYVRSRVDGLSEVDLTTSGF
ncbi:MAG: hypothetical protein ACKOPM_06090 [Novosphingobium sp.]